MPIHLSCFSDFGVSPPFNISDSHPYLGEEDEMPSRMTPINHNAYRLYATDLDFKDAYENCREGRTSQKFVIHDGLLYRPSKLCVPVSFVRLMLLPEAHGGSLMGHFGVKKTEDVLSAHFFWPWLRHDVGRYVA
jgi:hypothetical protein